MVLSETAVSTVMQVSVTAAGLLLAIYALIIPISRRIFSERANYLKKKNEEFENIRETLSPDASNKQFKELQSLAEEIKGTRDVPKILTTGISIPLTLYFILSIVSWTELSGIGRVLMEPPL